MARTSAKTVSTTAVLRLLAAGDEEEICGAALVLGALTPTDRRVIPALARAAERVPLPLRPYILDALGRFSDFRAAKAIAPRLLESGALREQATRLLRAYGDDVVPLLRRLRREATEIGITALVRVATDLATPASFDFLIELLEDAPFERAKYIMGAVGHQASGLSARERGALVARVRTFLEDGGGNPTAEIAAVKILGILKDPRGLTPVVARLDPACRTALRQAAAEALTQMRIPASRHATVARRLLPILDEFHRPRLAGAALRGLTRLDVPVLDSARLMEVARSDQPELARIALRELGKHRPKSVVEALLDGLLRENTSLQMAAAGSLAEHPEAMEHLIAAHEDPRFRDRRTAIIEILENRAGTLETRRFRRLAQELLRDQSVPGVLGARLQVLATLDRVATNRLVEARARQRFGVGDPDAAIRLLEPLVRGRYASPRGRYLLALAHLRRAAGSGPGTGDHERAMQLLGPLARLGAWRLRPVLFRETRLTRAELQAIAAHLMTRPEPEHALGAALRDRLGDDEAGPQAPRTR